MLRTRKSEILNSKSETNNNSLNSNVYIFEHSSFDIVSSFDIRASNLLVRSISSRCLSADNFRSISFPSRGAFHLSLTVLVHYR